jgi:hypothetical protein
MANPQPMTPEQAAERELEVINAAAKRVHTVLCGQAEAMARTHGQGGYCTAADSLALIKGAVSGIAVLVARMALERNPTSEDSRTVEEYFGDQLKEQFVHTFREVQQRDALAEQERLQEAGSQPS